MINPTTIHCKVIYAESWDICIDRRSNQLQFRSNLHCDTLLALKITPGLSEYKCSLWDHQGLHSHLLMIVVLRQVVHLICLVCIAIYFLTPVLAAPSQWYLPSIDEVTNPQVGGIKYEASTLDSARRQMKSQSPMVLSMNHDIGLFRNHFRRTPIYTLWFLATDQWDCAAQA